jgi:hypothetical protein
MPINEAEKKRLARIAALTDRALLWELIANDHELTPLERESFRDMDDGLDRGNKLTPKQRAWAESAAKRFFPLVAGEVPKGKPVVTPAVLLNLPKHPPGRKPR